MENLQSEQPIIWIEVIDPNSGAIFYTPISGSVTLRNTSVSLATTASYALSGGSGGGGGGTTNTGSLLTTASFSNPNLTFTKGNGSTFNVNISSLVITSASYAATASHFSGTITSTSASYATTASYVLNAVSSSFALTASFVQNSQTSSYVLNAISASFASTASFVRNAQTASYVLNAVSSSFATTSSIASSAVNVDITDNPSYGGVTFYPTFVSSTSGPTNLQTDSSVFTYNPNTNTLTTTASYATNAESSSFSSTASFYGGSVTSASYATTSSYVLNAISASRSISSSYALTASFVPNAITPSGGEGAIQFQFGSGIAGSNRFTFDSNNNIVNINNGATLNATGSLLGTSSFATQALTSSIAVTALTTRATANATYFPIFVDSSNGSATPETLWSSTGNITINPSLGSVSATSFTGSLLGTASYATQALSASYFSGSISNAISSSYALTASYAFNAGGGSGNGFPFSGSAVITGSLLVSGSGITGSLLGTSSYSLTAYQAEQIMSYRNTTDGTFYLSFVADNNSSPTREELYTNDTLLVNPGSGIITATTFQGNASSADTATLAISANTASYVLNAISSSFASTASFVRNAQTASYVLNAISSSFASTASFVQNAQTASYVVTAQTASYVLNAVSSSRAITSSYALTASFVNPLTQSLTLTGSFLQNGTTTITSTSSPSLILNGIVGGGGAAISASGYGTKGGSAYLDFLQVTNTTGSATNPSKFFRIDNTGNFQIINSSYGQNIFQLSDLGNLYVNGATAAGVSNNDGTSGSLMFNNNHSQIYDDGNMHIHSRISGDSMWINTNGAQLNLLTQTPIVGGASGSGVAIGSTNLIGYVTINNGKSYTTSANYGYLTTSGAGTYPGGSQTLNISLYATQRIWGQEIDAFSDERMKDIQGEISLEDGLKLVTTLKPIKYTWKEGDDKGLKAGYSAQQVSKAGFDHLIGLAPKEGLEETIDEDGFVSPKDTQFAMNYDQVTPYHGVVIKHLLEKIEQLEQRISQLEKQ